MPYHRNPILEQLRYYSNLAEITAPDAPRYNIILNELDKYVEKSEHQRKLKKVHIEMQMLIFAEMMYQYLAIELIYNIQSVAIKML